MILGQSEYTKLPPHLRDLFTKLPNPGSEEVTECFPQSKGMRPRTLGINALGQAAGWNQHDNRPTLHEGYEDEGSAARFFPTLGYSDDERRILYCPKASKRDRAGSKHPTIKPVRLIEWLCKLICPPGGMLLDPFAGSGTTGQAATNLGFDCILIEREDEYVKDIEKRLMIVNT